MRTENGEKSISDLPQHDSKYFIGSTFERSVTGSLNFDHITKKFLEFIISLWMISNTKWLIIIINKVH